MYIYVYIHITNFCLGPMYSRVLLKVSSLLDLDIWNTSSHLFKGQRINLHNTLYHYSIN